MIKTIRIGRRIYFTDLEGCYLYYRQEYDFMSPRFDEVPKKDGKYPFDRQEIFNKLTTSI